jgi:hypothetical protein
VIAGGQKKASAKVVLSSKIGSMRPIPERRTEFEARLVTCCKRLGWLLHLCPGTLGMFSDILPIAKKRVAEAPLLSLQMGEGRPILQQHLSEQRILWNLWNINLRPQLRLPRHLRCVAHPLRPMRNPGFVSVDTYAVERNTTHYSPRWKCLYPINRWSRRASFRYFGRDTRSPLESSQ